MSGPIRQFVMSYFCDVMTGFLLHMKVRVVLCNFDKKISLSVLEWE